MNKHTFWALVILAGLVFWVVSAQLKDNQVTDPNNLTEKEQVMEDVQELKLEDIKMGEGAEAETGKKVTVHYSGMLTNGTKFDSSYDRGTPFSFTLGAGEVIQGWDLGVKGMKVGGKRKLTIPSHLGYGERGAGADIPPNATLIFEIELLEVE